MFNYSMMMNGMMMTGMMMFLTQIKAVIWDPPLVAEEVVILAAVLI